MFCLCDDVCDIVCVLLLVDFIVSLCLFVVCLLLLLLCECVVVVELLFELCIGDEGYGVVWVFVLCVLGCVVFLLRFV